MGVSSSELLSSSSDSSDWISSTMERRGPGRAQDFTNHHRRNKAHRGQETLPWPGFCPGSKSESELESELELEFEGLEGADCCTSEEINQIKETELLALTGSTESVFCCSKAVQINSLEITHSHG